MPREQNEGPEGYDKPEGKTILDLGDTKKVQAELGEWEGNKNFSVRQWYKKKDGFWYRGKGLTVPRDKARELIRNLSKYAESSGRK